MSTPTIRAALERLVAAHDARPLNTCFLANLTNAIANARAALAAERVGDGPSEEAIAEMAENLEWRRLPLAEGTGNSFFLDLALAILARWGHPATPPAPEAGEVGPSLEEVEGLCEEHCFNVEGCESIECLQGLINDALTRWGRPTTPPAPEAGEVAELSAVLLADAECLSAEQPDLTQATSQQLTRIAALLQQQAAPAQPAPEVQRDAVIAAVTEALGGAYDCLRVWEAWSVGTMGQDDFALVAEDDSRVAEIADAAIAAMRPAAPPAPEPGEVGELADRLGWIAAQLGDIGWSDDSASVARAATLLSQQAAPAPVVVAVAERPWEREGWCDGQGRCWFFSPRFNTWSWERPPVALTRGVGRFLSLPAHAIPLPQAGEGEV